MIPRRSRGRQSQEAEAKFSQELGAFVDLLLQMDSTLDFKVCARGWCYQLEPHGLEKGDFDDAEDLINYCRKEGLLPIDFVAEDEGRSFDCVEWVGTPEEAAQEIVQSLEDAHEYYNPVSFWDAKPYFLQMLVEKIDLVSLFEPICQIYHIPIATAKGWSSISQRAELAGRFRECESRRPIPVLLYCGDHDPGGIHIEEKLRENLYRAS